MKTPDWLDRNEYPYQLNSVDIEGHQMKYLDEGSGEAILFVHGTPSWSFEYRKIIQGLVKKYRCIAPDHLGFGLSDKPEGIDYTPAGHAKRLGQLVKILRLEKFHLVVHDFGGPIGISMAIDRLKQNPACLQSLTIINSWLWPVAGMEHFQKPEKLICSPVGKFLYEKLNFSARVLLKSAFSGKKELRKVHSQYIKAQDSAGRKAAYQLALALYNESDWFRQLWDQRFVLEKIPSDIIWGKGDTLLPAALFLDQWREGLPLAKIHEVEGGHFPHEENAGKVIQIFKR